MQPQLLSGARGVISVTDADGNENILGMVLDISINPVYGQQQTFVCGAFNATSIDPVSMDISGSLSRVIPISMAGQPTTPNPKFSAIDLGLMQSIQNALKAKSVVITLRDKITDKVMGSIRECRGSGESLSGSAQNLFTARTNFIGIFDGSYDNQQTAPKLGYLA